MTAINLNDIYFNGFSSTIGQSDEKWTDLNIRHIGNQNGDAMACKMNSNQSNKPKDSDPIEESDLISSPSKGFVLPFWVSAESWNCWVTSKMYISPSLDFIDANQKNFQAPWTRSVSRMVMKLTTLF